MTSPAPVLPMRRLGSSVVHLVAIRREDLVILQWVGPPFPGTIAPVVSVCGADLYGTKTWMQNGTVCRRCQRVADRHGHPVEFHHPSTTSEEAEEEGEGSGHGG